MERRRAVNLARARVEEAFRRLARREGFAERPAQVQLALLLADLIEGGSTGAIEAPTGLGKSLAALIPAFAYGLEGKRIVISTYTNVLAEQYWREDLPLARSLVDGAETVRASFLIGRARYACKAALAGEPPLPIDVANVTLGLSTEERSVFESGAELGLESEFRRWVRRPPREASQLWSQIAVPPVCPARQCPFYNECYYYRARRMAEKANVVVTNHSVVLQDALMRDASDGDIELLGAYDFLVVDEAHDIVAAAMAGLEFELDPSAIDRVSGLILRTGFLAQEASPNPTSAEIAAGLAQEAQQALAVARAGLTHLGMSLHEGAILTAGPDPVLHDEAVRQRLAPETRTAAEKCADQAAEAVLRFVVDIARLMSAWEDDVPRSKEARATLQAYLVYLKEFSRGCDALFEPRGTAVTHASTRRQGGAVRYDVVDVADPLRHLLWTKTPYACLSATLALDHSFEFFCRGSGAEPVFTEVLPSPFDYGSHAAMYLPAVGVIPDPSLARREGSEEAYFAAVAKEVSEIIELMGGRTLALFHSRRELEQVNQRLSVPDDLPVLVQRGSNAASVGDRFRRNIHASLLGVRSFWTGFDAPGETLSCVIIVRAPFEVPVDPPALARAAWMRLQGRDSFHEYSLAHAKLMVRQAVGRLLRRSEDRGLIAILDPRLRTKRYGDQILQNLPADLRVYEDKRDAIGALGF